MPPAVAVAPDPIAAEMARIEALRATLVIHHPFWASLLLPMHIDAVCGLPTFAATDCVKHIWINPDWTRHLNYRQLGYVIIHEAGHVAFLHGLRRVVRDHDKWNISADLAIACMLEEMVDANGKKLYERPDIDIPGLGRFRPLYEEWAKGLTAEEIYDRLPEQRATRCPLCGDPHRDTKAKGDGKSGKPGQQAPQNGAGSGNNQSQAGPQNPTAPRSGSSDTVPSQPQNGTDSGGCQAHPWAHGHCQPGQTCLQIPETLTEEQAQDLIDHVHAAYESWIASNQRGTMPASLSRFIQRLRAAKVPWQRVLHQYAGTALAKDNYSLSPPHRRWLQHDLIRPSLRSETIALLVLVFDTSGSISRPMAAEFAAEGANLHTLCEETLILTGDCQVQQVIRTQRVPEFLCTLEFKGGGGTSHVPIFTWLKEHRLTPDLLVACTDLYSEYPDRKPPFPVLWCTKEGHGAGPPWGRIVIIPEKTP